MNRNVKSWRLIVCFLGTVWVSGVVADISAQNLSYTPTPSIPVGRSPQALAGGDFNGDGLWDLATVNGTSDDVSILLGNGNGTFRSAVSFGVGKIPLALIAADLDRDGELDLILGLSGADQVVVLKGEGTGFFRKRSKHYSGKGTTFLGAKDLNGDGWVDVVAVNSGRFGYYPPFDIAVLFNDGQGRLKEAVKYETTDRDGMFPTGVFIEDYSGDAFPDLAISWSQPSWRSPNGLVSILENDGKGVFTRSQEIRPGFTLSAIHGADVNHDEKGDLIITSLYGDSVRILLQQEDRTFQALDPIKVGFAPVGIAIHDFNGDQDRDVVVVNRDSNSLSILLGDGKGQFRSAGHFGVGATPAAVVVQDFNQDHLPDFATAGTNIDSVSVLLSGDGAIPLPSVSTDLLVFEIESVGSQQIQPVVQQIRLSNIGLGQLHVVDFVINGKSASAFSMRENTCQGVKLAMGDSCTIHVAFNSDSRGIHHATLTIQDNANGSPRLVELKGIIKG